MGLCSKGIEGIYWKNIHLMGSELFYLFLTWIGLLSIHIFMEISRSKWQKENSNICVVMLQRGYLAVLIWLFHIFQYSDFQVAQGEPRGLQSLYSVNNRWNPNFRVHRDVGNICNWWSIFSENLPLNSKLIHTWMFCFVEQVEWWTLFIWISLLLLFQNSYSHKYLDWLVVLVITLRSWQ